MKTGDHRYLHGQPITLVYSIDFGSGNTGWGYVEGHVGIHEVSMSDMLPMEVSPSTEWNAND